MMVVKVALQMLIIGLLVIVVFTTHQVWSEQDCYGEKVLVVKRCWKTIEIGVAYENPTSKCRRTVESSDVACVCRIITTDEEAYISVSKLVKLARECGKQFPDGSKCGSK